jgi:hypothetical protein
MDQVLQTVGMKSFLRRNSLDSHKGIQALYMGLRCVNPLSEWSTLGINQFGRYNTNLRANIFIAEEETCTEVLRRNILRVCDHQLSYSGQYNVLNGLGG